MPKLIHPKFIYRQLTTARQQSIIFVLCVALALITLVGLNSFGDSVNNALRSDARELQAGDILIDTQQEPSNELLAEITQLEADGGVERTLVRELFTVARITDEDASLLTQLKVIEPNYPFYGEVEIGSAESLHVKLTAGFVIVEPLVLERLDLSVGDPIRIGEATLTIADTLLYDPVQPVNFFAFGPAILVAAADIDKLDLIKPGSRVDYRTLLEVPNENRHDPIVEQLQRIVDPEVDRVRTYKDSQAGIQRFFNNLLFFLSLVAVFILILAGIGIQSALTAFLRERDNTVAIVKTVGATNRFVTVNFLCVIVILGTIGTVIGLLGGLLLQRVFPLLLADFLPPDVTLRTSPRIIIESLILSAVVVGIFTYLPFSRLKELRPNFILRKESIPMPRDRWFFATLALLVCFFVGMVLWQLDDLLRSLYFVGGTLVLVLITASVTEAILFGLRGMHIKRLDLRQALRGLFRPRNATRAIIITLAAALTVIFTIYLLEENLDAAFVSSFPDDADNVFMIDIQPDQRAGVDALIQEEIGAALVNPPIFYPVVRGNIVTINSEEIDREAARERRGDNLARQFNLTYREALLEDELLLAGDALFNPEVEGVQVSVLDEVFEMREFQIGDRITFRVQGIPIDATISSVRSRTSESFAPFFYWVFPTDALASAPQNIFTSLRVPEAQIGSLQNQLVAQFPNISVIDITQAVDSFAATARQLSQVIRFLTFFSIAAGLLIIVSSIYATRFARIQEAVYFKVLGAKGRFVLRVFAWENLLLGLVSALIALGLAQLSSWALSYWIFEIDYAPQLGASLLLIVVTVLLVMMVGLLASVSILNQRPIIFLREQGVE